MGQPVSVYLPVHWSKDAQADSAILSRVRIPHTDVPQRHVGLDRHTTLQHRLIYLERHHNRLWLEEFGLWIGCAWLLIRGRIAVLRPDSTDLITANLDSDLEDGRVDALIGAPHASVHVQVVGGLLPFVELCTLGSGYDSPKPTPMTPTLYPTIPFHSRVWVERKFPVLIPVYDGVVEPAFGVIVLEAGKRFVRVQLVNTNS